MKVGDNEGGIGDGVGLPAMYVGLHDGAAEDDDFGDVVGTGVGDPTKNIGTDDG